MPNFNPIPVQGKVLALDIGAKRVGVAVSDSAQTTALAKGQWPRPWKDLKTNILASGAVGVILGEPLHLSGAPSAGAQGITDLAKLIATELNLPVALADERLTSRAAEAAFAENRVTGSRQTRASKKDAVGHIDSAAAVLFLQTWLDARKNRA
jgi:putative Holliday junction resolvase